ncbi:hypothetical protein LPJ78_002292 [Coemansia sp. RSA 989]|nr:hypothetical protein LPJ78_002292 [Coemansia sp. RSA 989]
MSSDKASDAAAASTAQDGPVNIIMIGMAGSGKTTLMQRINAHLHERKQSPYVVNLDPAVSKLPFQANIDIRDTVDYKQVMSEYNLGPNGGILTSLNLFTTKLDQVMQIIDKRAASTKYFLYDTPGQIEIFTWSASGAIISNTLAATYPTVVVYVVDTPRTASPATFMSNMMYACSILYKTQLPFLLAFNKTDVVSHEFAVNWMSDFEAFQQALSRQEECFMNSLMQSMSLVLDEFYSHLRVCGVSAMTGQGMEDFFDKIQDAVREYHEEFKPNLQKQIEQKRIKEQEQKEEQLKRLMNDLAVSEALDEAKQRVQQEFRDKTKGSFVKFIIRLLAPECWLLLSVIVTSIGAAVVSVWVPVVMGDLVSVITRSASSLDIVEKLKSPARRLVGLALANGLLTFAHTTLVTILGERVGSRLHAQALDALLWHDMAFFDSAQSGSIVARVSADVREFQSTFKKLVTLGLKSLALTGGVAWQLISLSPQLSLTLTLGMTGAYSCLLLYGQKLRRLRRAATEWESISSGIASEAIANMRTVRTLNAEAAELNLFSEARAEQMAHASRFGLHMGCFQGLTSIAVGMGMASVLYGGGKLVAQGHLSAGELIAFVSATQAAQRALDALGVLLSQAVRARGCISRVQETIGLVPQHPRTGVQLENPQGHVRFMDVDFSYPTRPHAPVLRQFNLDVPAGQVIALCGESGSGKSTVASLLERFYEPSRGAIWLDACPLTHLDTQWHRKQIGFIPQDPALFSTTIRENLRLANPQANNIEIEQACKLANAHGFIMQFPHGYDTVVGERGALLSGGQKQRIAIARALLRNPRILILDEATSALDAESERIVQQALDRLMAGRTVLIIAHRLSTIKAADRIVVMDKDAPGNIAEQGTHEELLQSRGAYYNLYHRSTTDI